MLIHFLCVLRHLYQKKLPESMTSSLFLYQTKMPRPLELALFSSYRLEMRADLQGSRSRRSDLQDSECALTALAAAIAVWPFMLALAMRTNSIIAFPANKPSVVLAQTSPAALAGD
jgi:hypothetical protein